MDMEVTFKQLVGKTRTRRGSVEVKQPVDRVYLDGVQVGVAHRRKGAGFCPIHRLSEAEEKAIVEALDKRDFGDDVEQIVNNHGKRKVAKLPAEEG